MGRGYGEGTAGVGERKREKMKAAAPHGLENKEGMKVYVSCNQLFSNLQIIWRSGTRVMRVQVRIPIREAEVEAEALLPETWGCPCC